MENVQNKLCIIRGDIVFTENKNKFTVISDGYLISKDGKVVGVYEELPHKFKYGHVEDYEGKLIIPGFVDLHMHAPQFNLCGLGYDRELLDWLNNYTFKEEAKFEDLDYSKSVYYDFVNELYENGITRSVIFGTIHKKSVQTLMELLYKKGLSSYVGKVNMDRNAPDYLKEDTLESLELTEDWIKEYCDKYKDVRPIITPRFVPSCSSKLMKGLGNIAAKYNIPVQSHLDENESEIELVKKLHKEADNYSSVYYMNGLFGQTPTIMAHCVHLNDDEIEMINKNNVFIAHCPNSNSNLSSGIAPISKLIDKGLNVGLGSDIGAGEKLNMFQNISDCIKMSKIRALYTNDGSRNIKLCEAFYLATKGGGKFFGKVGSFEKGYELDALVIDDDKFWKFYKGTIEERLEKLIYIGNKSNIIKNINCKTYENK